MILQQGDILVTRNAGGEDINSSPGWYNHAAIVGEGVIVEAQIDPGKVIASDMTEFWNRYPIIVVRRLNNTEARAEAGKNAMSLIGVHYRAISSFFVFHRKADRGMNCVSVVRTAVWRAIRQDPRWRIPDDVFRSELLETVFEKQPVPIGNRNDTVDAR